MKQFAITATLILIFHILTLSIRFSDSYHGYSEQDINQLLVLDNLNQGVMIILLNMIAWKYWNICKNQTVIMLNQVGNGKAYCQTSISLLISNADTAEDMSRILKKKGLPKKLEIGGSWSPKECIPMYKVHIKKLLQMYH